MREHYVSFEQAKALKQLGFKEEVTHYYCNFSRDGEVKLWSANHTDNHNARLSINGIYSAPFLDKAQAWLREVKYIQNRQLNGTVRKHNASSRRLHGGASGIAR